MRSVYWVPAVLMMGSLTSSAAEFGPGCAACAKSSHRGLYAAYAAPACAATAYGMVPGCCEFSPSCCDDAWAGYCQERGHRRSAARPRCHHRPVPACPSCGRGAFHAVGWSQPRPLGAGAAMGSAPHDEVAPGDVLPPPEAPVFP